MTYEGGVGSTQVAAFEYDALGRRISSQLRFDADANAMNETLKYYYDGQNVIAEYDESNNLSRRYMHGTSHIDERAVLLEGEGETLDEYYYLLRELGTVAGLITCNGTLAEAYTYDAYGNVTMWGYRPGDFNRDGDVDGSGEGTDYDEFMEGYGTYPSADAMGDMWIDGTTDSLDFAVMAYYATSPDEPPITLHRSGVGNPYFFTGRRLHFFETLHDGSPEDTEANQRVQYIRARCESRFVGRSNSTAQSKLKQSGGVDR